MTKVSTKRAVVQARAVALVAVALVFAVAFVVIGPKQTPELVVTRSIAFKGTSTISSSSTSQNAALLYLGVERHLWYSSTGSSVGYASAQSPPRAFVFLSLSVTKEPAPVITEAPESLTYDTSAHFGFMDQGQHDGFRCRLDSAPVAPCGLNGVNYGGSASGATASRYGRSTADSAVRQRHSAGASPRLRSWAVQDRWERCRTSFTQGLARPLTSPSRTPSRSPSR